MPTMRIIGFLLLWIAAPAWAELSVPEKQALRQLNAVIGCTETVQQRIPNTCYRSVESVLWNLGEASQYGWTPALSEAFIQIATVQLYLNKALFLLVHANIDEAPQPAFLTREDAAVEQWVSEAKGYLDKALVHQKIAETPLKAALTEATVDQQKTYVTQALTLYGRTRPAVEALVPQLKALAFLDWQPKSYPALVGPHGDFHAIVNELGITMTRLEMGYGVMKSAELTYRIHKRWLYSLTQLRHALLKFIGIPLQLWQCGLNDFQLVVQGLRHILAWDYPGMAIHQKEIHLWLARSPYTPVRDSLEEFLGYAVMHVMGAVWFSMNFPHTERLCTPGAPCANTSAAIAPPAWPEGLCEGFPQ